MGVEVVAGSFDDPGAIAAAAAGMEAMFAVTTPALGAERERAQGRTLAEAARAAGVGHLVLSSAAGADRETGIPHFESKRAVERHCADLGIDFTVVAPASFFENVQSFGNGAEVAQGWFRQPLASSTRLAQVAVEDIGRFVAKVIEVGVPFFGRRIELAGDTLTGPEMAAVLSKATGRAVEYLEQPIEDVASPDLRAMYAWLDRGGCQVDVEALEREHPEVGWHSFESWACEQDWDRLLSAAA